MTMKGKGLAKALFAFLFVSVMLMMMVLPASASNSDPYDVDSNGTLVAINLKWISNRSDIVIPDTVKTITVGVVKQGGLASGWYAKPSEVKTISIPSSVTTIKNGAFSNCTNLTKVTIDNYKEEVIVESGAFPDSISVIYNKVKPTTTKPTTTVAPKAAKVTPTTPQVVKQSVATTAKPVATTKVKKTKVTTTKPDETTTETTTEVIVTEEVPFADAKAQLNDKNVWENMVSQSTDVVREPTPVKNTLASTASYAAVVVVAISAIALGYFKFKK